MRMSKTLACGLVACGFVLGLPGCGGEGGGDTKNAVPAAQIYSIGGSVSGLSGSLVLQNNAGDDLSISANGAFTFATKESSGATYSVTMLTPPATQTCSVSNGSGAVSAGNVSNISVVCSTSAYKVGGSISGLNGTVVLEDNGSDSLARTANGAFVFSAPVAQGSPFLVTVQSNPAGQSCSVANGSGTIGTGDINNVAITCTTNAYTVGGNLSGLSAGVITLQNNGGDSLSRSVNGSFTFPSAVAYGNPYHITVSSQPANLSCPVTNPSGIVNANVTSIAVTCSCASGYSLCSAACVNTSSDSANCGACGAVCPANYACSAGSCVAAACTSNANCTGGDVCLGGTCRVPACNDGVRDGNETGLDCGGGTCSACAAGQGCSASGDCLSGVCTAGACQSATCSDGVKNETETDVDCGGGVCAGCAMGKSCLVPSDCQSGVCTGGICQASACSDGFKDGNETDVDCGGGTCAACAAGRSCLAASDCLSGVCAAGVCQ